MPRTRSNRVETPPPPEAPPSPTYTPTSPTYAPPSTTQGEEQAPQSTQPYDPYSASAASAYQRDPYHRDPYASSYNRGATSYNHDQGATSYNRDQGATSYNRDQGATSYNRDRSDMSGAYDPMNPGYSGQSRADRRHEPYRNQPQLQQRWRTGRTLAVLGSTIDDLDSKARVERARLSPSAEDGYGARILCRVLGGSHGYHCTRCQS